MDSCSSCSSLSALNKKLTQQISSTTNILAETSSKNNSLYETIISQQEFLSNLSCSLEEYHQDKLKHENTLKSTLSENETLKIEIQTLSQKLTMANNSTNEIKSSFDETRVLLKNAIAELETERNAKNSLIEELQNSHQIQQSLREQIMDLEYEIRQCVEKLGYMTSLKNEMHELNTFVKELKDQNLQLRIELDKNPQTIIKKQVLDDSKVLQFSKENADPEKSRISNFYLEKNESYVDAETINKHNITPERQHENDSCNRQSRSKTRKGFRNTPSPTQFPFKNEISKEKNSLAYSKLNDLNTRLVPWYEMENSNQKNFETPTFLFEEAEKARSTVAEFTEFIKQLSTE